MLCEAPVFLSLSFASRQLHLFVLVKVLGLTLHPNVDTAKCSNRGKLSGWAGLVPSSQSMYGTRPVYLAIRKRATIQVQRQSHKLPGCAYPPRNPPEGRKTTSPVAESVRPAWAGWQHPSLHAARRRLAGGELTQDESCGVLRQTGSCSCVRLWWGVT